jgi:hypothetical protein
MSSSSQLFTTAAMLLAVSALALPGTHAPAPQAPPAIESTATSAAHTVVAQYNPCPSGNCRR